MRLVLLGDPVSHSRSPAIQQAAFDHCGIAAVYTARRVDSAGMPAAVDSVRSGLLDGANVTMPHKVLAAELVDRLDADAARAGAVNTLVRRGDGVHGHLTDVTGMRRAWATRGLSESAPVLVLGAGGAAAAALLALDGRSVSIAARRRRAAADLVARLATGATVVPWPGEGADAVVVNATPIGMAGEALPEAATAGASGLFDMVYGAGTTPAEAAARASRIPVANGLDMLVAQAIDAFELWTGRLAPAEVMVARLA